MYNFGRNLVNLQGVELEFLRLTLTLTLTLFISDPPYFSWFLFLRHHDEDSFTQKRCFLGKLYPE